jgi:hypothetical protein
MRWRGFGILFSRQAELQRLTEIRTIDVISDTGGQLCERHCHDRFGWD